MKMGFRTPSVKKSITARTTGRIKRSAKKAVNPLYGKKGVGYIKNPTKAVKNSVYHKTTFGVSDIVSSVSSTSQKKSNGSNSKNTNYNYNSYNFSKEKEKKVKTKKIPVGERKATLSDKISSEIVLAILALIVFFINFAIIANISTVLSLINTIILVPLGIYLAIKFWKTETVTEYKTVSIDEESKGNNQYQFEEYKSNLKIAEKRNEVEYYKPLDLTESQVKAIFLNWCAKKGTSPTKTDYPIWIKRQLNISPRTYHTSLIQEGYLIKAHPEESLKCLKVSELKRILERKGLETSGKKEVLIDRIANNVNLDTLNLEDKYKLSDKAQNLLSSRTNRELLYAFKNRYSISLEEFNDAKSDLAYRGEPNEIMQRAIEKGYEKARKEGYYGTARNYRLSYGYFWEDEKEYEKALQAYIDVMRYDFSGSENQMPLPKKDIRIAPGILKLIQKLSEYYNEDMVSKSYEISLPVNHYSEAYFKKIINSIINRTDLYKKYL